MCPLHAYLRNQILRQSVHEPLVLDRAAVEALLDECSGYPCGGQGEAIPARAMTVGELADTIEVGHSTVRGWCNAGLFGFESIMVGRSWMIPPPQVALTVGRYRAGWRVVRNKWVQPGMPPPKREDDPERRGHVGKKEKKAQKTGGAGGPASEQRPDYGGYKDD